MLVSLLWIGLWRCAMFTIYFSPFVAQDPYNFPPSTCQTVQYLNILHEVTYNVDGDFTLQLSVERLQRKQKKFHCKCVFFIITESTFNSLLFFYTHEHRFFEIQRLFNSATVCNSSLKQSISYFSAWHLDIA